MELTQEHFNEVIKGLATKEDIEKLTNRMDGFASKDDLKKQTEELAGIISVSFDGEREHLQKTLDVTNRVMTLEKDLQEIKEALHIR